MPRGVGIPALVAALLNVFAPATPQRFSKPACAGAAARGAPCFGVTVGDFGNFARSGPGLSSAQTDRFEKDCTIGFDGYCIGDGVQDALIKRDWLETRWLRIERHDRQPAEFIAQKLSGETTDTRFVAVASIAPKSGDQKLKYLGAAACPG